MVSRRRRAQLLGLRADARVTRRHRARMDSAREMFGTPAFDRLVQLYDEARAMQKRIWEEAGPDPIISQLKHAPEPRDTDDPDASNDEVFA